MVRKVTIAFVVVGILIVLYLLMAYYGVPSISARSIPWRCDFGFGTGADLLCYDGEYMINASNTNSIIMKVHNMESYEWTITQADVYFKPTLSSRYQLCKDFRVNGETQTSYTLLPNSSYHFSFDCPGISDFGVGNRISLQVEIKAITQGKPVTVEGYISADLEGPRTEKRLFGSRTLHKLVKEVSKSWFITAILLIPFVVGIIVLVQFVNNWQMLSLGQRIFLSLIALFLLFIIILYLMLIIGVINP